MAEFGGIGECAVAIAEHDFIIVVIFARDYEISNSISIEVRSRYMELGSPSRQLKRRREPERAIAGAKEDCSGIRSEIRYDKVKIAIAGKVADRDGRDRSKDGNVARRNHIAPAVAKKLQERATAVSRNHVEIAVSVEIAHNQRAGIRADQVMRSHAHEYAIGLAELDGKKMLTGLFAVRQCRLHYVGNSIPVEVPRGYQNGRFVVGNAR